MRLVDAHHHLWDLRAVEYPWLEARGVRRFFGDPTPIQRDYGVADLRADARPHEIAASVHVQVGCRPGLEVEETRWLQRTGEREGLPSAIVAHVDLAAPDVARQLRVHAGCPRLRGVRQIVGREPVDDARTGAGRVLEAPGFVAGLRELAAADLSFDLQLTVPQLPQACAVLDAVPELRVAVCHAGSPWDRSRAGLAEWRRGLERLARRPHAACKLSGLSMFDPGWTAASFAAIADAVLGIFGAERVMFGSNYPVDGLHRGYAEIVAATFEAAARHDARAPEQVFGATARAFYRLD